jgi:amino acid adenylation domain-containing protein
MSFNQLKNENRKEIKKMNKAEERSNAQADALPARETVIEWIHKGAKGSENVTALRFGQTKLSYSQLQKQSNQIAHYLIDYGVKKGDRVGITLERSIELITCIIGILKSGAAYVPMDPNYPPDRLDMMKEDANLRLLITHKTYADRFDIAADNVVIWEEIEDQIAAYSAKEPAVPLEGKDIAYIIFTSGSTGRPKGIMMPHRALSNLIEWQLEREYFKKAARVLQYSSISFDVSFQEISTTLASGGALYLVKDNERRDPRLLLKKLDEFHIERLFIPFVALRSLIEVAISTNSIPKFLKEVITAGEQLRVDAAVRSFFAQSPENAILDNQYGPSETHVISAHLLGKNPSTWPDLPSIGKPLKNNSIYILDESMQSVATGETGELYLSGRNLAQGYVGRDDLTKKSFIKNPFQDPDRPILYKTGDLGRYNNDGSIEFLGRSDHQIKIRGYRVELGEINSMGAKFPGIAHCFTHASRDASGRNQLNTYFVRKSGIEVNKEQFKLYLSESLPDYMAPAFIMEIEKIPYTPSGKVDLKALPQPQQRVLDAEKREKTDYKSETEAKLAKIWKKLLGFETISRTSNFFNLGGDSLLTVTLLVEIEQQFGKDLPLSVLIKDPTVEGLSRRIEEKVEEIEVTKFRSLQPIQAGIKNEAPLFFVHGNLFAFGELAKTLDPDIPVFALQWPGYDGGRGENDIVKMAKFYKKELRAAWPSGPYRLGGNCTGGIIALEMARLLRAEGAEIVSPILAIDAPNFHSVSYRLNEPGISDEEFLTFRKVREKLESRIPPKARELKKPVANDNIVAIQPTGVRKMIRKMPYYRFFKPPAKSFYHRLKFFVKRGQQAAIYFKFWSLLQLSKPIPAQERDKYADISQIHAIRTYKKQIYDEDILYLRSSHIRARTLGLRGWWSDIFMGFGELCSGHFDPYVIGGSPPDILKNPYAQQLIKDKMFFADKNLL